MAFALADPVCHIFNASISQAVVPTCWKRANVVVIPKTNPPSNINSDLRPISLTPTLSKILESFIGGWLLQQISSKFDDNQYGAIKGRSTTHELVHYMHLCHRAIENHRVVRTLFVDFSKAFDHVDHSIIIKKMENLDVQPFVVNWMRSFLTSREQRVKIGCITSEWVTLNGGMPQGSWLGPYIFLIHINDLKAGHTLFKFIDDVTAIEDFDKMCDQSSMQQSADSIRNWSDVNNMNINIRKTKEMIMDMGTKNNSKSYLPPLTVDDEQIERVSSFKLLGVVIDDNLKWNSHVHQICSKANKRIFFLKLLKRSGMSTEDLLYYYKSIIRSVVEYACPVWQSGLTADQKHQIENIQKRSLAIITGTRDDYQLACCNYDLQFLVSRLEDLARGFFNKISVESDCINFLIPAEPAGKNRDLRSSHAHNQFYCKSNRFGNSFIPFAVNNYR
jgi:hypothetical protein